MELQFQQLVYPPCCAVQVSYSRRTFGQTGDGHFSPIGGYHAGKDLVLILDVARFKVCCTGFYAKQTNIRISLEGSTLERTCGWVNGCVSWCSSLS